MPSSRRPIRPIAPLAAFLLALCCLQGCLFSWGGKDPGGVVPVDGEKPPVGRGYFTISLPNASHRLHLDSIYTVGWRASDSAADGPVRISLFRNDVALGPLLSSLDDSGSFAWDLLGSRSLGDYRLGSGPDYRLRVVSEADSSHWDFSSPFTLYSDYAGSLELTSPGPGAQVRGDSTLRIAWKLSGTIGTRVGLQIHRGTGLVEGFSPIIAPAGMNEYLWSEIPEWLPSGDDYRIRIFANSDPSIGQLGPAFTLTFPTPNGTYEFLRPGIGDTWLAGQVGEVEWRVTGNPGSTSLLTLWRDSPREYIMGWTPGDTFRASGTLSLPSDLVTGTYRMRISSWIDTTLFAFSQPFNIQEVVPP